MIDRVVGRMFDTASDITSIPAETAAAILLSGYCIKRFEAKKASFAISSGIIGYNAAKSTSLHMAKLSKSLTTESNDYNRFKEQHEINELYYKRIEKEKGNIYTANKDIATFASHLLKQPEAKEYTLHYPRKLFAMDSSDNVETVYTSTIDSSHIKYSNDDSITNQEVDLETSLQQILYRTQEIEGMCTHKKIFCLQYSGKVISDNNTWIHTLSNIIDSINSIVSNNYFSIICAASAMAAGIYVDDHYENDTLSIAINGVAGFQLMESICT